MIIFFRQCKVTPSNFKDEESIVNHVDAVAQLIGKMVDFDKVFHLTLMGLSVCDFTSSDKGNITAFLLSKRPLEDQDSQAGKKARVENIMPEPSLPEVVPNKVTSDAQVTTTQCKISSKFSPILFFEKTV